MLEPGTVLANRYTILKPLGRGGMGAVYLASMEALGGKKVALKEMELQGHNPTEVQAALKQFQTEATFLANLDHPNLVSVSDFFAEGNRYYLVMAYVDGQTLDQKLRQAGQPFDWTQVREWSLVLCDVLHYLHTYNPPILFRDLKPSNIMVDRNGTLKLIDFGIARVGEAGSKTSTFLQGTGTSGFSPIEQYGGSGSTDARSDVYSLGATMYMLLTGQVPPDAVSRLSGKSIRPPSLLKPELNHAIDAVILRALAQLAKDRFQTIEELRRALSDAPAMPNPTQPSVAQADPVAAPGDPSGAAPPSKPEPPKIRFETFPTQLQPKARASTWMIALASLATACVALSAISSLRPKSETGYQPTAKPLAAVETRATASQTPQVAAAKSTPDLPSGFPVSSEASARSTRLKQQKPATKPAPQPAESRQPSRLAAAPRVSAPISEDNYPKAKPKAASEAPVRPRARLQRLQQERQPLPVATQPAEAGYPPPPPFPGPPPNGDENRFGRPGPPPGPGMGMPRPPEEAEEGIPGLNTPRRRRR